MAATRFLGTAMLIAIGIYWCVTLTGPVPALQEAIGDRHAYVATLIPIVLAAFALEAFARLRRPRSAIPLASVHRDKP